MRSRRKEKAFISDTENFYLSILPLALPFSPSHLRAEPLEFFNGQGRPYLEEMSGKF